MYIYIDMCACANRLQECSLQLPSVGGNIFYWLWWQWHLQMNTAGMFLSVVNRWKCFPFCDSQQCHLQVKGGNVPFRCQWMETVMSVTGMWEQLLHCLLFMHTYNYDNSIKLKFVLLSKSVMSCSLLWIYFYLWEVCFCRQIILVVVNKYKF